jgi:hypothetical protein
MHCPFAIAALAGVVLSMVAAESRAADVTATETPQGVRVTIGDQLFTEYLTHSVSRPILWPIVGPTGQPMTRAFPMDKTVAGEKTDHVHQRSLWFAHGSVNGVSFWEEAPDHGTIQHRRFVTVRSGPQAVVETETDWPAPGAKKVCEDRRRLTFGADGDRRWIDFDITLVASVGPVKFGDTKEGTFGIRVAETITVDANHGGRIITSEGAVDDKAWGTRAAWVDYHGPVAGQTVGIAVMNHPKSLRFPTYWQVRPYGLFAANPFGAHEMTNGKAPDGAYTLPKGESVSFYYRVLLHKGDEKEGKVADSYQEYEKAPK